MNKTYFVTGTDTEVGKTLVACALIHALRRQGHSVAAMKPVSAGLDADGHNEDVSRLQVAANVQADIELMAPYRFRAAIAPHLAARQESRRIEESVVLAAYHKLTLLADTVVIEGVGGFRVPLDESESVCWDSADLVTRLDCPVILVVGLRLGCINHALLTAEAIIHRGLTLAGWIGNTLDPDMAALEDNIHTLTKLLPAPQLGLIPHLPDPLNAEKASQFIDLSRLPYAKPSDSPAKPQAEGGGRC